MSQNKIKNNHNYHILKAIVGQITNTVKPKQLKVLTYSEYLNTKRIPYISCIINITASSPLKGEEYLVCLDNNQITIYKQSIRLFGPIDLIEPNSIEQILKFFKTC